MKISSKGRYGLAAMIHIANKGRNGDYITIVSIAEELKISKIYLEQVFSLLKRANLVNSVKGAQGGYQLARSASKITAKDILEAIEISLFEATDATVKNSAYGIEKSMNDLLWTQLDNQVAATLSSVTLEALAEDANKYDDDQALMFYI